MIAEYSCFSDNQTMVRGRPAHRGFTNGAFLLMLVGTLVLFFNNCGILVQPGLDNMELASVGYQHTGAETSCSVCHEKQRPAPVAGNPHGTGADCVNCHQVDAWTNVSGFSHSPTPSTCINCHLNKRPTGPVGSKQFDHAKGGTGDCVSCHASQAGITWSGGNFSHSPQPTSCLDCHIGSRPSGLIGNPPFDHAKGGTGDCVFCHKNPGVSWAGGSYNHNPAPTSCTGCHLSRRPTGLVGNPPFDHANGGTGDCAACHKSPGVTWAGGSYSHSPLPTSCNSCHSGNRPAVAKYPDGTQANGHYAIKDCYACHRPKSSTVTSFNFNHGNAANQAITFCLPCHLTRGRNEHGNQSNVSFTGDGNCYNCHRTRRSWSRN